MLALTRGYNFHFSHIQDVTLWQREVLANKRHSTWEIHLISMIGKVQIIISLTDLRILANTVEFPTHEFLMETLEVWENPSES